MNVETLKLVGFFSILLASQFLGVALLGAAETTVTVRNFEQLQSAVASLNRGDWNGSSEVKIVIAAKITFTDNLDEIIVPDGMKLTICGAESGIVLDGADRYRGFVIHGGNASVAIANLKFNRCVADGENGGNGSVAGGGGGAGLGGAIYLKSGHLELLDVQFTNNEATGGDGGHFVPGGDSQYGEGGESGGGDGGSVYSGGEDGEFGGGGGGSPNSDLPGNGGLGAGDGGAETDDGQDGGSGGGALGAGGAVFVDHEATLTVKYSEIDSSQGNTIFSGNTVVGGAAGGPEAGAGDAIGDAIFAAGDIIFDTSDSSGNAKTMVISEDIGGIGGANNYADADQDDVRDYAGGIAVQGGGTLRLTGTNTYVGTTEIQNGTLLADGGEAIGDFSEVSLSADGILELAADETIGFLTDDAANPGGEVHLYRTDEEGKKIGGRTLTVSGDGDENLFGINPVTGEAVGAFTGTIMTDGNAATNEKLVKKGTGLLVLGGDNTNAGDEFSTELYDGTIRLDHARGLGGGTLTVHARDRADGSGALQIGAALLRNDSSVEIENDVTISGTSAYFGVGLENGYDGAAEISLSGTISGTGTLVVDMNDSDQVLRLTNVGESVESGGVFSRTGLNSYGNTILRRGTLAVLGAFDTSTQRWVTGLGGGKVIVESANAAFCADTDGMVVDNVFEIASPSLTLTNAEHVHSYTLGGTISGPGGLVIDLYAPTDAVMLSGALQYEGETEIVRGILKLGDSRETLRLIGGLSASEQGTLDLNGVSLIVHDTISSDFLGSIIDTSARQDGGIIKTGAGTWNLQLQNTLNRLTVEEGNVTFSGDDLSQVHLNRQGTISLLGDAYVKSVQSDSASSKIVVDHHQLTIAGTGESYAGVLEGDGTIILENGDVPEVDGATMPNWILYGNSSEHWTGTIAVQTGATLGVAGAGALGRFDASKGDVATVKLDESTLAVGVPGYMALLGRLDLSDGNGTVETAPGSGLYLGDLYGSGDFVKSQDGFVIFAGENEAFSGNVVHGGGRIILFEDATLGSGTLISAADDSESGGSESEGNGSGKHFNTLEIYAHEETESRTINNDIVLENDLYVSYFSTPDLVLDGALSGDGNLVISSQGKTIFAGEYDAFGGILLVDSGVVQLGHIAGGGSVDMRNATIGIDTGATLDASGEVGRISVAPGGNLVISGASTTLDLDVLELLPGGNIFIDCDGITSGTIVIDGEERSIIAGGTVHVNVTDQVELGDVFTFLEIAEGTDLDVLNQLSFSDNLDGMRIVGMFDEQSGLYRYEFVSFNYLDGVRTANARNVGNYLNDVLDHASVPSSMNPALNRLEELLGNDPGLADIAYGELSGEVYASTGIAQIQALTTLNQTLVNQLRPAASLRRWDGTGGDAYVERGQIHSDRGLSAWMSAYGLFGSVDSDGNASGYDLDVYGGMVAVERCSNNLARRLGIYYAYGDTTVDTNTTLGRGRSDDHRLGLYVKWDDRFGYGIINGNVGFNSFTFDRRIAVVAADAMRGAFDGTQASFHAERGTTLNFAGTALQPFVAIQYAFQSQDSFGEHGGSGFRLHADASDVNSLRTMLGSRFIKECYGKRGMLQLHLQGYWMHEYLDETASLYGRFAGITSGRSFEIDGSGPGTDWAVFGLGAQWSPTAYGRLNLFGSYDAQLGSDATLHSGHFGLKVVW